ncbi:transposase [Corynebacterium cystitidis]|uniref:transposase n=1 Tax=Corynebacterium cystitidis TaxID=35757 RepID=UPI00358DA713
MTDDEWGLLEPLLPAPPPHSGAGPVFGTYAFWSAVSSVRICTGCPWRDASERYGP